MSQDDHQVMACYVSQTEADDSVRIACLLLCQRVCIVCLLLCDRGHKRLSVVHTVGGVYSGSIRVMMSL